MHKCVHICCYADCTYPYVCRYMCIIVYIPVITLDLIKCTHIRRYSFINNHNVLVIRCEYSFYELELQFIDEDVIIISSQRYAQDRSTTPARPAMAGPVF